MPIGILHQYLQEEWRIGYSEPGEHCSGHGAALPINTQCLILRARHIERDLWGPPLQVYCMTCADLMDVRVGPKGGAIRRDDDFRNDYASLTREFWNGVRDIERQKRQFRKRMF